MSRLGRELWVMRASFSRPSRLSSQASIVRSFAVHGYQPSPRSPLDKRIGGKEPPPRHLYENSLFRFMSVMASLLAGATAVHLTLAPDEVRSSLFVRAGT